MNDMHIPYQFLVYALVFGLLLAFGIGYNVFVAYLERKHLEEGYVSLLVVFGVLVTLVGVAIINQMSALLALLAFSASGTPMIVGSLIRYALARQKANETLRDDYKTNLSA
jgi:hypothetical protein